MLFKYLWRMILITGSTGLVGTHLLAKLLAVKPPEILRPLFRDEQKKAYSLLIIKQVYGEEMYQKATLCEWEKGDILDLPRMSDLFEGVSYVYHCAGFISNSPSDRSLLRKINVEGTKNIVNLALDFKVKKLLHVSSIATLGKPKSGNHINENHHKESLQNISYYSLAKYGAEMEVWRASQEGLPMVIVNPGVILGEGFYTSGSGRIFEQAYNNLPFYLPKVTGFTSVRNLSNAMHELMESEIVNDRFIVVDANENFGKVQKQIAKALNKKIPKFKLQKWLLHLFWLIELVLSPFRKRNLTWDVIDGMLVSKVYETTKIKNKIGFREEDIPIHIEEISKHYLQNV